MRSNNPIRRAHLIAPFGVGSIMVTTDGNSLICCGLDHWYKNETDYKTDIEVQEYVIKEWRLERTLNVNHFRLPPDYRIYYKGDNNINKLLKIPFLRFPKWHFCKRCGTLYEQPLTILGKPKCLECYQNKKTSYLIQAPFITICQNGHIQDFPWREWVHHSINPKCNKKIRLISSGRSSTLSDLQVTCECGEKRTLGNITVNNDITKMLSKEAKYYCKGKKPWLGSDDVSTCDKELKVALTSASNVYFPQVKSSIYLPRSTEDISSELISLLEEPPISSLIGYFKDNGIEIKAKQIKEQHSLLVKEFTEKEIDDGIKIVSSNSKKSIEKLEVKNEDSETNFRREEYEIIRNELNELFLQTKEMKIHEFDSPINNFFSKINLVKKLRETRVLVGFNRLFPENELTIEQLKNHMWKNPPEQKESWLPGYVVYGEGIYIEFNEKKLNKWINENQIVIKNRLTPLIKRYVQIQEDRHLKNRPINARFILAHTFSHLIMNRLSFECGYSSASLRERLYISDNPDNPMAGVLIYTSAGDSDGTMGGLVRMGMPGNFEKIFKRAIENACWCSSDPVCMEMGAHGGQGPDACNLAACHSCVLVPETACEEFNRFLDRGLLVGDPTNSLKGYFNY